MVSKSYKSNNFVIFSIRYVTVYFFLNCITLGNEGNLVPYSTHISFNDNNNINNNHYYHFMVLSCQNQSFQIAKILRSFR